jgi:maltose alpha-D-glucosyltransferase/alpha-amylase
MRAADGGTTLARARVVARARPAHRPARNPGPDDPEWYKDAIIYELHVRSFQDSNADGVGDFPGLTSRLPYLQDLGVTAIWLLPFYPSPLRDDGYDIADYTDVHASYGTLEDFNCFLEEAHRRGLRVITELVINHTSDQHPWFQRARTRPAGDPARDFYVWSPTADRYQGTRVIFRDFEHSNWTWDPVGQAYYWHRFYSHQPDLNFDNPAVLEAVRGVIDFWLELGVDGLRLDAVPYLVEREGTRSENLRPTHRILKQIRRHVDERFLHRMLLAEANQWPEDAAAYFGSGDESHMVFHFPLMPRLFMAMRQEDRLPIVDILAQTPAAPRGCQWALFLRNHDELTLEMVTEEERQYMYYVYASDPQARLNLGIRRRLAPLVGNDRRRIELMNMLLFSLPGTPILYYGDEIGMGDNIYLGDRNAVRTPMQWSADRNAGFSSAATQRLFLPLIVDDQYHYQSIHVEQQSASGSSLLAWMRRLIAVRRRHQAFGRGDTTFVDSANVAILAYVRDWQRERLLVVANLSRFAQHATLALQGFDGNVPVELFGRKPFPAIGTGPYTLTLAPHQCLWFELEPKRRRRVRDMLPRLRAERRWDDLLNDSARPELEAALPPYLERCASWTSGGRAVLSVRVEETLRVSTNGRRFALLIVQLTFTTGEPQHYLLPLGCRPGTSSSELEHAIAIVSFVRGSKGDHVLYDASEDPHLARALRTLVRDRGSVDGRAGSLRVERHGERRMVAGVAGRHLVRRPRRGPNALVGLGNDIVLKLFRQLDAGPNPEIELCSYLNARGFAWSPPVYASLHYRSHESRRRDSVALGILLQYVRNDGEAWSRACAAADAFLRRAARGIRPWPVVASIVPPIGDRAGSSDLDRLIGPLLPFVQLLGSRVAELHVVLGRGNSDAAFAPKPLGPLSRRSMYQRMRTLIVSVTGRLRRMQDALPPRMRALAGAVIERQQDVIRTVRRVVDLDDGGQGIRCHGNLHLGQVLVLEDDIMFIDFEGEPGRPLYERLLKRSPLQDVATMIRSFQYAAHHALLRKGPVPRARPAEMTAWLRAWQHRLSSVFLASYLQAIEQAGLLPRDAADRSVLLQALLLERAYYELGFELNRQRDWVAAPLADIPALLA